MADKVRVAAVIRQDLFVTGEDCVTVVSVLYDLDEARSEARRLNELNGTKGMRYFARVSSLCPEASGVIEDDDHLRKRKPLSGAGIVTEGQAPRRLEFVGELGQWEVTLTSGHVVSLKAHAFSVEGDDDVFVA